MQFNSLAVLLFVMTCHAGHAAYGTMRIHYLFTMLSFRIVAYLIILVL